MSQKKEGKNFRDEILENLNISNYNLVPILSKELKKYPKGNYEQAEALRNILLDIEYCENTVSEKITLAKEQKSKSDDKLESAEIRTVKEWALKKYIKVYSEFLLSIFIADLSIKKWINEDYETRYLQIQVDIIDDQLEKESELGNNLMFDINNEFLKGVYPDMLKWDMGVISFVEASIGFRKYLKEQLAERNPNPIRQQISIQGEINGEKDVEGNLIITLPLQQIENSIKESIKLERKEVDIKPASNNKNLYTRKETAALLKISSQTLSNWTKNGTITAHRIGNKHLRYKREDIEKVVKEIRTVSFNKPNS
jgi:excisionase family DNA binding protein